jgi:hypothetical protein
MEEGTRGRGAPAASQDRPIGDLAKQLSEQVSRLVREELRLAELEMTRKGKRLGFGAAMFGSGGAIALYGVAAVLAAVILLLAKVMPAWGSALVVGVLFVISATLAALGRKQVRGAAPPVPQQTVDSVKADVEEIKERAHR